MAGIVVRASSLLDRIPVNRKCSVPRWIPGAFCPKCPQYMVKS